MCPEILTEVRRPYLLQTSTEEKSVSRPITLDVCPYPSCSVRGVAFNCLTEVPGAAHHGPRRPYFKQVLSTCGMCGGAVVMIVEATTVHLPFSSMHNGEWIENYKIRAVYPTPRVLGCPSDLPPGVEAAFMDGQRALQNEIYTPAAVMFRKALEVAVKGLGGKGRNLHDRIQSLASDPGITPAMLDWAHTVRLDANDGVHDDEPVTKEIAEELRDFAEDFLVYVFEMPKRVEARRAARAAKAAKPS